MMASMSSTFTGRVVSVNDKGLKLEGHESWMNLSKFAPDVVLPARGELVTIVVDSKGFLRSCAPATIAGGSEDAIAQKPAHNATGGQKDRTITRLAVLKAAASFASTRPDATSADVLKVAEVWERWVLRADDGAAGAAQF